MKGPLALLLFLVLLSGCFGPSEEDAPTPTSPTDAAEPTPTPDAPSPATPTPEEPTPATPTAATPDAPPTQEAAPLAPMVFYHNLTHDYAQAPETEKLRVPEGTVELEIALDFQPGATATGWACAGSLRMTVKRPDGTTYADVLAAPAAGVGSPETAHCGVTSASAEAGRGGAVVPGEWTVEFTGQGTGIGHVRVAPAADA